MPRIHAGSGLVTVGCFATHSQPCSLQLPVQSGIGVPLSPQKQEMDATPTQLDGMRVHCALASTKALKPCMSDVPGHGILTVNRSDCPFPLAGWSQGPSSPGHGSHCSLLVNIN